MADQALPQFGYLECDGIVVGPIAPHDVRRMVQEDPGFDWRFSSDGVSFEALPDWTKQKRRPPPSGAALPLDPGRKWPDTGAWHQRLVRFASIAVLVGVFLPASAMGIDPARLVWLWEAFTSSSWHWYGAFAFALLPLCGILAALALRERNLGVRAVRLVVLSGLVIYIYGTAHHPALGAGDLLFNGLLVGPSADGISRSTMASLNALPFGSVACAVLALLGCALIAAGTRVEARYLGFRRPVLARVGGWVVVAVFLLPTGDTFLAKALFVDPISAGGEELPTSLVALTVFAYGLLGIGAGWFPTRRRLGVQLRRILLYTIVIAAPLASYAALSGRYGYGASFIVALLRDICVVYGILTLFGASLAAWAIDAVPHQRAPAPKDTFIPGSLQRRQGTLSLALVILAVAPTPVFQFSEDGGWRTEARWLPERVWDAVRGAEPWQSWKMPSWGIVWLLVPLGMAVALYVASRLRLRRGACVFGAAVLGVVLLHPGSAIQAGLGEAGPQVIRHQAVKAILDTGNREISSQVNLDVLAGIALGLAAAAVLLARLCMRCLFRPI